MQLEEQVEEIKDSTVGSIRSTERADRDVQRRQSWQGCRYGWWKSEEVG
jgi:hypothetical protein